MLIPAMRGMNYPCLCLCFGFLQITYNVLCRFTVLQFLHNGFTAARTLIVLFIAVYDPSLGRVIGAQLHRDLVTRKNADPMNNQLASQVSQDLSAVVKLYFEF